MHNQKIILPIQFDITLFCITAKISKPKAEADAEPKVDQRQYTGMLVERLEDGGIADIGKIEERGGIIRITRKCPNSIFT